MLTAHSQLKQDTIWLLFFVGLKEWRCLFSCNSHSLLLWLGSAANLSVLPCASSTFVLACKAQLPAHISGSAWKAKLWTAEGPGGRGEARGQEMGQERGDEGPGGRLGSWTSLLTWTSPDCLGLVVGIDGESCSLTSVLLFQKSPRLSLQSSRG